jgi:hypothetical protein
MIHEYYSVPPFLGRQCDRSLRTGERRRGGAARGGAVRRTRDHGAPRHDRPARRPAPQRRPGAERARQNPRQVLNTNFTGLAQSLGQRFQWGVSAKLRGQRVSSGPTLRISGTRRPGGPASRTTRWFRAGGVRDRGGGGDRADLPRPPLPRVHPARGGRGAWLRPRLSVSALPASRQH